MSYYSGAASTNPLAFPSYNQPNQRNIGLNGIATPQLYSRQHLAPHLQNTEAGASGGNGAASAEGYKGAESYKGSEAFKATEYKPGESFKAGEFKAAEKKDTDKKSGRKNRPGQKFGAKKKLWVWTWFVQDLNDANVAVCDYCGRIITRMPSDKGLPKKLSEHLRTHKLTKELINTTRAIPIDGNGITYNPGALLMPYSGYLGDMPAPVLQPQSEDDIAPELKKKFRRPQQAHQLQHLQLQLSQQLQNQQLQQLQQLQMLGGGSGGGGSGGTGQGQGQSGQNVQFGRRFILPNFDNTPYSGVKFHKHLLKFLADNKLLIRILKLHLFQQLIYDLRPDSITDLLELTGLYLSFIEVARVDGEESLAEANVVNTLAQELIKK